MAVLHGAGEGCVGTKGGLLIWDQLFAELREDLQTRKSCNSLICGGKSLWDGAEQLLRRIKPPFAEMLFLKAVSVVYNNKPTPAPRPPPEN